MMPPSNEDKGRENGHRKPEEIEEDIQRTREELGETINALQDKLSPDTIKAEAKDAVRTRVHRAREGVVKFANEKPVVITAIGISVAAVVLSRFLFGRGHGFIGLAVGAGLGALVYRSVRHGREADQARGQYIEAQHISASPY